jgi:hypothetical protein
MNPDYALNKIPRWHIQVQEALTSTLHCACQFYQSITHTEKCKSQECHLMSRTTWICRCAQHRINKHVYQHPRSPLSYTVLLSPKETNTPACNNPGKLGRCCPPHSWNRGIVLHVFLCVWLLLCQGKSLPRNPASHCALGSLQSPVSSISRRQMGKKAHLAST